MRAGPKRISTALLVLLGLANPSLAQNTFKTEVVSQIGHGEWVYAVAFSPNDEQVLSGSEDGTLKLWDTLTGALLRTFKGHERVVNSVAFSADGRQVVSGADDSTVKLWDATTGALLHDHRVYAKVHSVAFSQSAQQVLLGTSYGALVLDAITGDVLQQFEVQKRSDGSFYYVRSAAFSPNGKRVLTGGDDKKVNLWDMNTGTLLHSFEGHTYVIMSVAFSPDGHRALSGSDDNNIVMWDLDTRKALRTLEGHSGRVTSVAFSKNGQLVISGSEDHTIKLWDASTGALLRTFEGHADIISSVAISRDSQQILSGGKGKILQLWNASTGALMRTFRGYADESVQSVAFSPDGTLLLSAGNNGTLRLANAATGALVQTSQAHKYAISSIAISPDGRQIVSGGSYAALKLWDASTGALLRTFVPEEQNPPFDRIYSVAFSPNGRQVLSGTERGVFQWDVHTGAIIRSFDRSSSSTCVTFSPDGRWIIAAIRSRIRVWDAVTGVRLQVMEGVPPIHTVAISPDGQQLVSGSLTGSLHLWDATTGQKLLGLNEDLDELDSVNSVAFSPDGSRMVSGHENKTLKVWDRATGRLLHSLVDHSDAVNSVAFSPDGRKVLSGSRDGTLRIWDPAGGTLLASHFAFQKDGWITITPQGFFASSTNGAEKMMSIVRGRKTTSIRQLHQSLFNPDLVNAALTNDPELQEAARYLNLDTVLDSAPAPHVVITSHSDYSTSASDLVTASARISDRGKGIGRIEWRVNGVTVGVSSPKTAGPQVVLRQQLALDQSSNVVEVVAYNRNNLLASVPAKVTIDFVGSPSNRKKPDLYILAIGIDKYIDKGGKASDSSELLRFGSLTLAAKDAAAVARALAQGGARRYGKVHTALVLNEDATKAKLERTVKNLASTINARDTFILFAAGHGISNSGRFYMIPQDYSGGANPNALAAKAIGQDRIQDWLSNRIKARNAVILLDTCESGALVAGHLRSRADNAASEAGVGRLHEATGRPVLTAAALGQFAYEGLVARSGDRHGLFTWALLDALRNGDKDQSGTIELSELVAHVQELVPKLAAELGGGGRPSVGTTITMEAPRQNARFGSRGEDFVLTDRLQ
jgi:WD40 repeat protein